MDVFGGGVVWGDNYGMVWISRILDWYTRVYRFRVKEELRACNGIVPLKVVAVSQGKCSKQDLYLGCFSLNIVSDTPGWHRCNAIDAVLNVELLAPPEVSQCWGVCCFTDLGWSTWSLEGLWHEWWRSSQVARILEDQERWGNREKTAGWMIAFWGDVDFNISVYKYTYITHIHVSIIHNLYLVRVSKVYCQNFIQFWAATLGSSSSFSA